MSPRRPTTIQHHEFGPIDLTDSRFAPVASYIAHLHRSITAIDIGPDTVEMHGEGRKHGDLGPRYSWTLRFPLAAPEGGEGLDYTYAGHEDPFTTERLFRVVDSVRDVLPGLGSPSADGSGPLWLDDPKAYEDGWDPCVAVRRGPILLAVHDEDFGVLVPPHRAFPAAAVELLREYASDSFRTAGDADAFVHQLDHLLRNTEETS